MSNVTGNSPLGLEPKPPEKNSIGDPEQFKNIKITAQERTMAIKSVKVLGLDVAGVDIIRSNKGPLLLEVNSSPGLEGIEAATGKDIAREVIISIEKKLGWKIPSES